MRRLEASITRREALTTLGLSSAAVVTGCAAAPPSVPAQPPVISTRGDQNMPLSPALSGEHTVVPLPFSPGALSGLSERLITSHHENNYGGAVRNLNRVERELSSIDKETPPVVIAALRERELTFRNSKSLHEAYFANLGGDGRRGGAIDAALAEAYGSAARWEEHFRATGMGLGGGSGWVILGLELDTSALRTFWSGNHTQVLALSSPLLVMDMYEHSYHIDFGASVDRYIDAFFSNVQWEEVNRRFERARRAAEVLRG